MDKIIFKISNNLLSVSVFNKDTPKDNLNNTNIIDTKNIVFSDDYIKDNLELVSSFLNVIIIKRNIGKISIRNYQIISLILDIIKNIPSLTELIILANEPINYDIFLKLLDNKYLEKLDVYDIPRYLLERLDTNTKLEIHVRSEILFISNFMKINNLETYSDLFYKKYLIIDKPFDKNDLNDYLTFISINKYLKVINFLTFNEELFKSLIIPLILKNKENIRIEFEEKTCDLKEVSNTVNSFKHHYEKNIKENNITFKINYSQEYKKNNIFKQLNLNFIKISLLAIIITVSLMMGINAYHNYIDQKNYEKIEANLKSLTKATTHKKSDSDILYIEPDEGDLTTTTTTSVYDKTYEKVFSSLLDINKDTVGWLTVNNTKIDYPVVQSSDNDYYLKKDFYQNSNRRGWIFMDYRNNPETLDQNTIIYGHNLANQTMFGTLRYALNSYWYNKTANQVITFNTPYGNMKWQIFSIYKVPVTIDYLVTVFPDENSFNNFVTLIKGRSVHDFNVDLSYEDKILTLSTCANNSDERMVIHAKLIK